MKCDQNGLRLAICCCWAAASISDTVQTCLNMTKQYDILVGAKVLTGMYSKTLKSFGNVVNLLLFSV